MAGVEKAADPTYRSDHGEAWEVGRVLATAIPRSLLQMGVDAGLLDNLDDMPGVADDEIAVTVDGTEQREAKAAAMRAHRSQINTVEGMWSVLMGLPSFPLESYVVLAGQPFVEDAEGDLFAGLDR